VGDVRHFPKLLPDRKRAFHRGGRAARPRGSRTRGNAESGFIRSVDDAVHRFYGTVVVHLDRPAARRVPTAGRAAVG
jgi:hypothetical protein